jgi:hypothetical protein
MKMKTKLIFFFIFFVLKLSKTKKNVNKYQFIHVLLDKM